MKKRFYAAGMFVFVVLSLSSGLGYRFYNQPKLDVGKIAPQTLTAPSSAHVEDVKTTEERRRETRSGTLAVWVVDPEINQQIHSYLQQLLATGALIRDKLGNFPLTKTTVLSTATQIYLRQAPESQWQTVLQTLEKNRNLNGLNLSQQLAVKQLRTYRKYNSSQAFSQLLKALIQARQRYNIALSSLRENALAQPKTLYDVTLLNLSDADWQKTQIQVRQTLDRILAQGIHPEVSKDNLNYAIEMQVSASVPKTAQPLARQLLLKVIVPNLIKDIEQTKLIAEQAAQAVEPTIVAIQKGEVIVKAEDKITHANFVLLDHFNLSQRGIDWLHLIRFSGMVGLAVAFFRLVEKRFSSKLRSSDYILILLLTLSAPLLIVLTKSFTGLAAIGLLVGSFYGASIGGTVMGLLAILLSIGTELSWHDLIPSAAGGIVGGLMAGQWRFPGREALRTREELASLGILIGLTQGVVYLLVNTALAPLWYNVLGIAVLKSLAGLIWSILGLGLSPYLEALFDLVTPIRLAELSNPNRPLLKRLAHEAPGTFQHTLFVATLAEAAARALHCNVELVRAGTLYHDIGKMHDPLGFIENQIGSPNKHDAINDPWKSAEIIKKHVSEGLVMARQYKLPTAIQAFIPEHQGTILIAYFYHQAQQQKEQNSQQILYESDFRYDGPIPQSKETGIVMLADACEAALRSQKDITPEAALAMVNKILKARWQDNQLVDSGLKRAEMSQIAHIFVQVWQQFHHQRIAYPKL
ncbi:HDIG domain-containing protein [Dulcicalothrix desertica PCC 7102]|uniref:HDIG domain-containing protein n=1 Tax=Dulcicalothrix desertica PCC 7102 TaxID=232991 RepID=A0A3S1CIR7_9CYAN|nr:HDIG domain-containing metalloprotein [Dulcicalothrix desertica]RUT04325.1 HDIG domain-containing protein [Dulcicalothrix desertica PCC 7102]TWH51180.1 metal dependent phosphohydrolase [Dulcicalothrix desertica PCC 7102]